LNSGPIISRMPLASGAGIDILELEVLPEVAATEHVLANVNLPSQCLIAAVIRENYVQVPGADDRLAPGDTVVALVQEEAVEGTVKLFSRGRT